MVQGTVVKLTGAVAFIDFGGRNEGYIELAEFSDAAERSEHRRHHSIRGRFLSAAASN